MRKTERIEIWRHNQRLWRNVRETNQQNLVPGYCPVHAVTEHLTSCMFIQSSEQEDECIASDKSAVPLADINYYAPSFTLLSFHDAL